MYIRFWKFIANTAYENILAYVWWCALPFVLILGLGTILHIIPKKCYKE